MPENKKKEFWPDGKCVCGFERPDGEPLRKVKCDHCGESGCPKCCTNPDAPQVYHRSCLIQKIRKAHAG